MKNSLLITAEALDGCSFGHGLPYDLPITNPVWVESEYIQQAYASGLVKIIIHNTETPCVLDDILYNKFIDMGIIDAEAIAEYAIAPTLQQPVFKPARAQVLDIVTMEGTLQNAGKKGFSNALVKVGMRDFAPYLQVVQPLEVDGEKVTAKFKVIQDGTCNMKVKQTKMGEGRNEDGTDYTITLTATPAPEAPTIDAFNFDHETVNEDEEITITGTLSGKTDHPELLRVKFEGGDRYVSVSQSARKGSGNDFSMKLLCANVGEANITLTQVGMGATREGIGKSVTKKITINPKPQAPVMQKPEPAQATVYVGEKIKLTSELTGELSHPELISADIKGLGKLGSITKEFAKADDDMVAEAEITTSKYGRTSLTIQQKNMGTDKNQKGEEFVTDIEVLPKVAPTVEKFAFDKYDVTEREVITGRAYLSGDTNHKDLLQFRVDSPTNLTVKKQPTLKEGYDYVEMEVTIGESEGPATMSIVQTGMGPEHDQESKPQQIKFNVSVYPEAPKMGKPTISPKTLTVGEDMTITMPLSGSKLTNLFKLKLCDFQQYFTVVQNLEYNEDKTEATMVLRAIKDGSFTMYIQQIQMGEGKNQNGTEYQEQITINPKPEAPTMGVMTFTPESVQVGEEITGTAPVTGKKDHPELFHVEVTGLSDKFEISQECQLDGGNNNATIKFRALKQGNDTVTVKQVKMGPDKNKNGTPYTKKLVATGGEA